jgi:hypothetical protein
MAVAVDATMTAGNGSGGKYAELASAAATMSTTGMTVGASASLLIAVAIWDTNTTTPISSPTATWNSVSMSLGANINLAGTAVSAAIFALVSPASGNKTLSLSWTHNAQVYVSAVSFTGTDTITGINAADNATTSNVNSLTVTSDTNGATVACYINDTATVPTTNFTQLFIASDLNGNGAANYNLGGTSNTHTFTSSPQTASVLAGVHVIAPSSTALTFEDDSYNTNLVQFIEPIVSIW